MIVVLTIRRAIVDEYIRDLLDAAAVEESNVDAAKTPSDYKPKDIAVRRPDQLEREQRRLAEEKVREDRKKEEAAGKA